MYIQSKQLGQSKTSQSIKVGYKKHTNKQTNTNITFIQTWFQLATVEKHEYLNLILPIVSVIDANYVFEVMQGHQ